jgi:ketosteroid isomerase-like protein
MTEVSTTPDPLETARRMLDAMSRRDFDALMPLYSAHAVLDRSAVGLEVIEGREAIRSFFEEWTGGV